MIFYTAFFMNRIEYAFHVTFLRNKISVKKVGEEMLELPLNLTSEKFVLVKFMMKYKTADNVWMQLQWYIMIYCLKLMYCNKLSKVLMVILAAPLNLTWKCIYLLSFVIVSWNIGKCYICNFNGGLPIGTLRFQLNSIQLLKWASCWLHM